MAISLEKAATVSLVKLLNEEAAAGKDLGELTANIILVIDYSASMEFSYNLFYTKGEIQELSDRVLGLSMTGLDNDKKVQVFPFDSDAYEPFEVNETNYQGCIENWRTIENHTVKKSFGRSETVKVYREMGGTNYSAVIDKIITYTESEGMLAPGQPPVLVVFQTDGKTANETLVKRKLKDAATKPIFWQFIGLGRDTSFLTLLDTLEDRVVDNVGTFGLSSIKNEPPEQFYDKLIDEPFRRWVPAARAAGILTV